MTLKSATAEPGAMHERIKRRFGTAYADGFIAVIDSGSKALLTEDLAWLRRSAKPRALPRIAQGIADGRRVLRALRLA